MTEPAALLKVLNAMTEFDTHHAEPWRNELASDLNELVGRAIYHLETTADESDIRFGQAVIRVVNRVAEFEDINTLTKTPAL